MVLHDFIITRALCNNLHIVALLMCDSTVADG